MRIFLVFVQQQKIWSLKSNIGMHKLSTESTEAKEYSTPVCPFIAEIWYNRAKYMIHQR